MDLIHPQTRGDLVDALRTAGADGRRVLVVGGRRHLDKGNPSEVDAELWTTQLDRVISYEPAEMIAVVEAGMRFGELDRVLAEGGQEWPADAPADATVGGIIAAAVNSPRRLRVGAIRDTVLEVELVTGDGRLVRGGGRTVKNVTGYDLPRLATGSLGTLGVIVQVALKLRPRPRAASTLFADGDGLELGARVLERVPAVAGALATATTVEVRLEGWEEETREQAALAQRELPGLRPLADGSAFPASAPWAGHPVVAEAAVPPSKVPAVAGAAGDAWGASLGMGLVWCGLRSDDGPLRTLRARVEELGGVAPVVQGPGGLGGTLPAADVHRRLKAAFDPAGVLAPGRFWGGI